MYGQGKKSQLKLTNLKIQFRILHAHSAGVPQLEHGFKPKLLAALPSPALLQTSAVLSSLTHSSVVLLMVPTPVLVKQQN